MSQIPWADFRSLKLCMAISESSLILPWSTPRHAKPTDLSQDLKTLNYWPQFRLHMAQLCRHRVPPRHNKDLLMKEHIACFASVSLCSPHEFLINKDYQKLSVIWLVNSWKSFRYLNSIHKIWGVWGMSRPVYDHCFLL